MFCDEWNGLPDKEFLAKLDPDLADLRDRLYSKAVPSDQLAGRLSPKWAKKLGLKIGMETDSNMLPTHLIYSDDHKHHHLANLCFGGPDLKTLYITESLSGDILVAKLPVAGKKLYSHM